MATFTWTATGAGGTTAWETPTAWFDSADLVNQSSSAFTTAPGGDYLVNGSNLLTIDEIGAGGTGTPDIANSLTVTDVAAFLLLHDGGGALDVSTTLSLNSLLNLGTAVGNAVLSIGDSAGGGTINLGSSGRLEGALGDSIEDIGTTPTKITGAGTIIAEGGVFEVGPSVQVAAGATTKFQINPNATLSFADAVSGGTIVFSTASGTGVLDVAALSTFGASVKNLFIAHGANNKTSYIDFLNVGTSATATLSNVVAATAGSATLNIFTHSGSQSVTIFGNFSAPNLNVNYLSDGVGGTNVFFADAPCYATGTAILTPDGEVAVESIQPGDVVMTSHSGQLVPRTVLWAGFREIDLVRHPRPEHVAPIRFRQDALGPGLPRRDLLLSPDHCLFLDGGLIPAKLLVNGMTIVRDLTPRSVCYHHIELNQHAVLIAEGVEAESYLDTGNRAFFSNAGLAMLLHPEFGINEHLRCWETDACAPLIVQPDLVRPVWERYTERARMLGFVEPPPPATTRDSDLHLVVDGRTVRPLADFEGSGKVRFAVPMGAASVRLKSRRVAAQDPRPWMKDSRSLGVAVRQLTLRDRSGETVLEADHPALTDGWHAAEYRDDGAPWRWTAGDAVLPILCDGPCLLEVALIESRLYADDGDRLAA